MNRTEVRLAIIGAGAVAEKRYLPAATRIEGLRVTHLVDIDLDRARELASEHGVPDALERYGDVLDEVDAAVVATPPSSHREIAVGCLDAGVHVLCEKPLAPSPEEGRAMVEAARRSRAILSLGMVRRQGRSVRLLRRCVERGVVGRVSRVEAEEGGEFGWPLRTDHVFDAEEGGVLRDAGSHLLDLVFWTVGAEDARVLDYEDDSWGGPEANARASLELDLGRTTVPARVEVSFTRSLDDRIRVHGQAGMLEAPTRGGAEVVFIPSDDPTPIRMVWGDGADSSRVEDFVGQLREFVSAVANETPPPIPAESGLMALEIIRDCHQRRALECRSWETPPRRAPENEELAPHAHV